MHFIIMFGVYMCYWCCTLLRKMKKVLEIRQMRKLWIKYESEKARKRRWKEEGYVHMCVGQWNLYNLSLALY